MQSTAESSSRPIGCPRRYRSATEAEKSNWTNSSDPCLAISQAPKEGAGWPCCRACSNDDRSSTVPLCQKPTLNRAGPPSKSSARGACLRISREQVTFLHTNIRPTSSSHPLPAISKSRAGCSLTV
ncbi:hypothetical protein GY45DRAFT_846653 [Cubamyces sp. BRFM 1775]|nr:hypothetical protein GY45DRAFT_846653 [Cubamyces sp. BRFM 1775]